MNKSCPFCGVADRGGRLSRAAFCFNCGRRLAGLPSVPPVRVPPKIKRSCCSGGGALVLLFAPLFALFVMASASRTCHYSSDSRASQTQRDYERIRPYLRRIDLYVTQRDFEHAQAEFRAATEAIRFRTNKALERAQEHIWDAMRDANRCMQRRY